MNSNATNATNASYAVRAAANLLQIIHEDNTLLVLNKPAGLLSVPGRGADKQDCLSLRAQQQYPDALIVHRLDQATSGLLLMARGTQMQSLLSRLFAARKVSKRYMAVVQGKLMQQQTTLDENAPIESWPMIDLPLRTDWERRPLQIVDKLQGKAAQTHYRVVSHDASADTTRLELAPITGRSHQLRVHLQAIGHPIVGDALYAAKHSNTTRMLLHATQLEFTHPLSQKPLCFTSAATF